MSIYLDYNTIASIFTTIMQYDLKKLKIDKRKDYFLPGTSILHHVEMTKVKVLSTVGSQSSQNLDIISHTKPNLVNHNLMPHLAHQSCHCSKYFWKTSFGMTLALSVVFC